MLDDVERRRFLVQPAREDPAPALVRSLDVDLDEGAGELLFLPRSGRFARAKPHDHVLPARGLSGMQRDILHDAVALVEDAEDRDALRHRRDSALTGRSRGHFAPAGTRRVLLLAAASARGERERNQQRCCSRSHAYSGIHGS
jgi:hypothetical protein